MGHDRDVTDDPSRPAEAQSGPLDTLQSAAASSLSPHDPHIEERPWAATVVKDGTAWTLGLAGMPMTGSAFTLDDAIDDLTEALREFALDRNAEACALGDVAARVRFQTAGELRATVADLVHAATAPGC